MKKPFTLKLKNLDVLESDATVYRGTMFHIGLVGVGFGHVEIVNLNTLQVTYKEEVNKIRLDEKIGYSLEFAQVAIEELQARLRARFEELLAGGQKIFTQITGIADYREALVRENNYAATGIQINLRKIVENDEPVMQLRLKTEYLNQDLKTTHQPEFFVALASTARAFTRETYRQYGLPNQRWNHNTNAPVNPAEYQDIQKDIDSTKGKVTVLGAPSFNPGLTAAAVVAQHPVG